MHKCTCTQLEVLMAYHRQLVASYLQVYIHGRQVQILDHWFKLAYM